jgi:hypothetical protein
MESKRTYLIVLFIMLAVSLGLNWPYLDSGFTADEIVIIHTMQQKPLPYSRWQGAWSGDASDMSWFGNPWWAEPGAIGSFFRPIPTLVMEASLGIFGYEAFPLHLLAVLLHGAIGFLVFLFLKNLTWRRALPLLAGLVYVICEDHSMSVGFISFITDILCVFFIGLSLIFHLSWLKRRRAASLIGALLTMIAAFGCKETAAVGPLALILTSFFFAKGEEDEISTLRTKLSIFLRNPLSWTPALGIMIIFLGLYKGLNLGGMNNLSYIDPVSNPILYAGHLVVHLPVMWLAALSPILPSILLFESKLLLPLAGLGLMFFVVFLAALRHLWKRTLVIWAFLLFHMALLPQLGTDAGERLLYFPFVFFSVIIASLIMEIPLLARQFNHDALGAPRIARIFGWYLLIGVVVLGLLISAATPFTYVKYSRNYLDRLSTAATHVSESDEQIIILNAPDFFALLMTDTLMEQEAGRSLDTYILSAHNAKVSIERTGERSFIITMDKKGWLTNFLAEAFRSQPKLEKGRIYRGSLFDATLLELTEDQTEVLSVQFDWHRPLKSPNMLFLYWNGTSFQPLDMESLPIAEQVRLN